MATAYLQYDITLSQLNIIAQLSENSNHHAAVVGKCGQCHIIS